MQSLDAELQITTYRNATAFLEKAQPVLEQAEVVNNVILGICRNMAQFPERVKADPYLAVVEDNSAVNLVAMMTPPNSLVLYSPTLDYKAAVELLAQDLQEKSWKAPGIVAPSNIAKAFAQTWTELTGIPHYEKIYEQLYQLTEVTPPQPVISGHLRLATEAEIDLVAEWAFAFSEEAIPELDREMAHELAKTSILDQKIFIWEDNKPVSMAYKSRTTRNGATVSLVYTPPNLRGHGYASACVAALSQLLLDEGYKFTNLFTDLSNPTSNAIYQKIGYRPVCDFTNIAFKDFGF